ncbi:MAG: hypothetical protein J3R72DRAFT_449039 [Linnemannia gamsii]|nr:MAG: hypothetical protein J3R72DRAFT_449039 [Linnemannia gamsii]
MQALDVVVVVVVVVVVWMNGKQQQNKQTDSVCVCEREKRGGHKRHGEKIGARFVRLGSSTTIIFVYNCSSHSPSKALSLAQASCCHRWLCYLFMCVVGIVLMSNPLIPLALPYPGLLLPYCTPYFCFDLPAIPPHILSRPHF